MGGQGGVAVPWPCQEQTLSSPPCACMAVLPACFCPSPVLQCILLTMFRVLFLASSPDTWTVLLLSSSKCSSRFLLLLWTGIQFEFEASFLICVFAPGLPRASFFPNPQNFAPSCKVTPKTSPHYCFPPLKPCSAQGHLPWSTM